MFFLLFAFTFSARNSTEGVDSRNVFPIRDLLVQCEVVPGPLLAWQGMAGLGRSFNNSKHDVFEPHSWG
uniref:Putative secreted protein n=1 Tax=Anopheles marajoara TaxID=58244 RepID=A0A2M4CEZ1_9DIPT